MTEDSETPPPDVPGAPTLPTRVAYWAVTIAFALALLEASSMLGYRAQSGQWPFEAEVARRRHAAAAGGARDTTAGLARAPAAEAVPDWLQDEMLHPYVGYVRNPSAGWDRLGFPGAVRALEPLGPDGFRVLIFGGSVAAQVCNGADVMREAIGSATSLAGREVQVVCAAMPGYKQPQQLMAMSYLSSLGASFDLAINIDGFNEINASFYQWEAHGVTPLYPHFWAMRTATVLDPTTVREVGMLANLREVRGELSQDINGSPWAHSFTVTVGWLVADRWLERSIRSRASHVARAAVASRSAITGPTPPSTRVEMFRMVADIWATSSVQMSHLSRGHDARYVHFLQPNQHVLQSKPLSAEERTSFYNEHIVETTNEGYRALRERAAELEAAGVTFHDLSSVFAGEERTVYEDDCCHVNRLGVDLLAEHIGRFVAAELDGDEARDLPAQP